MTKRYYFGLLAAALARPAAAQSSNPAPPLPAPPAVADTLRRPPFRGELPDSLAPAPAPGGTVQVQGQEQPARPFLTVQDQLHAVAGVQVTPYDGSPGSGSVVRIRGASVAQGQAQPLYVVDGLPALNDDLTPGQSPGLFSLAAARFFDQYYQANIAEQNAETGASPLQVLPPEAIASIEVLAGPAAVARYGPLGANGVVSIQTRRGLAGRPLRVHYRAYVGVQQVRQRYELLEASEYAALANEATRQRFGPSVPLPFADTNLGAGTNWQAETYRLAGLQQHNVSLDGGRGNTTYLLGLDYRRQAGVLHGSDLTRLGLRLALDQRVGTHLTLRGTAALGQTDQHLPNTFGTQGAVQAALLAPPNQTVRDAQGNYSGYGPYTYYPSAQLTFTNPLAIAELAYRAPRTRRALAQLAATYTPLAHLTVEAAANFQRTVLAADGQLPVYSLTNGQLRAPSSSYSATTQAYRISQWGARLAVRYHRQLGTRHAVGAEIDYQYQAADVFARSELRGQPNPSSGFPASMSYVEQRGEFRLHRPWAALHYSFDSTLAVQAGLSYGHYRDANRTEYYPSAELSWQAGTRWRLWLGAARTSTLGMGYSAGGPARLDNRPVGPAPYQSPLYTDQAETGLRLGRRHGRLTGQLVAYQRTSYHALIGTQVPVSTSGGTFTYLTVFDEATIRNQGLELTLTADWQRGRLQGTTRLVGSLNRNRLRENNGVPPFNEVYDNQPTGAFYGYQQEGLNADGSLRFRQRPGSSYAVLNQAVLGSGIPAQLLGLSQQLRLGRLALDAQVDGLFGYQVINQQLNFLDLPSGSFNSATTVRDRWTPTHTNTTVPVAGTSFGSPYLGANSISDRLLESGNNVRLSSLTLTYRLRQTATQDISIWVGGQNLFVLTAYRGYDPNVSSGGSTPYQAGQDYGAVPVPRTWLLGVKADF
ncbi:TonB-dependent receptor plug domain-containing protein [Hymenobacter sp. DH14]|uniref:TonB-dependent receptor plug domain-containing protein n=1 Tax=Hymenobacter cyanobacteriorum TaxID=2926463 RepID=A0A9X1VKL4_9BACT|nr:TonB-dependent receptor plug domain-containing protein [Hymenobacter cyanobacteriorum]MCI1187991.1 TonB-dependent receptor plug domain-containing protein [Hymenobacter cyanobacteriorum]